MNNDTFYHILYELQSNSYIFFSECIVYFIQTQIFFHVDVLLIICDKRENCLLLMNSIQFLSCTNCLDH